MTSGQEETASLLVVSSKELTSAALEALRASAVALGHGSSVRFECLAGLTSLDIVLMVHECDPWDVVAVDSTAIALLKDAFADEADALEPDNPVWVRGYLFVAVLGFEECLSDQDAKRVAWTRLKAAAHPAAPY